MSRPRECGSFHRVTKDQKVSVPLYALFNDEVLELTENTKAQAKVRVEYRLLGKKMQATLPPRTHHVSPERDDLGRR